MKKIITSIAVIACVIMAAPVAHAFDGTINFIGNLVDTTCTVSINGGAETGTVTLPTLATNALTENGETAGETPFTIKLTECSAQDGVKVVADFLLGREINAAGRLVNMLSMAGGGATNVELEILDAAMGLPGTPIRLADSTQLSATPATITGGNATLPYTVRYYATDQATSGRIESKVTFLLAYE